MKKDKKIKVLEELKEKSSRARSFVVTDYRGLTHKQMEEIKKALRACGADFVVTKNTLLKLALPSSTIHYLSSSLVGPTATLFVYKERAPASSFSYEDEITPLSTLARFIKNFGLPKIKIGVLGDKVLPSEEILRLASLPSREVLMATLVARLKSPMSGLHSCLNWNLQKLAIILKEVSKDGRR